MSSILNKILHGDCLEQMKLIEKIEKVLEGTEFHIVKLGGVDGYISFNDEGGSFFDLNTEKSSKHLKNILEEQKPRFEFNFMANRSGSDYHAHKVSKTFDRLYHIQHILAYPL